jgi:hypothetical protein
MRIAIILVTSAALAVSACGTAESPKDETASTATGTNAVAPDDKAPPAATETAAATPGAGTAPTKEFMVGKWGEDGDCALAIGFNADGTMDGPFDGWELNGAELTMVGNPQKMTLSVIDANTMESRLEGGKPNKLTRC